MAESLDDSSDVPTIFTTQSSSFPSTRTTTMAAAPTREALTSLYTNMLRTSQSFSSYNFRHYFVRKTKDTFKAMEVRMSIPSKQPRLISNPATQAEKDTSKLSTMYNDAVREHTVLKRSAIVNQLYGGWRLAVENEGQEGIRERGDI
ncbi:hypothetical protein HWV62_44830 [Athelia sp. TMB]|nr:hypothetical protein HWV62_44830 [Athelia sp. TMB]